MTTPEDEDPRMKPRNVDKAITKLEEQVKGGPSLAQVWREGHSPYLQGDHERDWNRTMSDPHSLEAEFATYTARAIEHDRVIARDRRSPKEARQAARERLKAAYKADKRNGWELWSILAKGLGPVGVLAAIAAANHMMVTPRGAIQQEARQLGHEVQAIAATGAGQVEGVLRCWGIGLPTHSHAAPATRMSNTRTAAPMPPGVGR